MKNIISWILGFVFIALIGYGLWVCMGNFMGGKRHAGFIEASGRIEGREYHASSKISGRVDEIYVEEGQEVSAGEKIALIYSPQLNAMIAQANAYSRKAEANFKLAQMEYERYSRLLAENAVPRSEFDQVENKYMLAKEESIAAKKELDKLDADLDDTKISAPAGGRVVSKIVQVGEVIAAGSPLVTIVNMSDLYLKVFLPTDQVGKIVINSEARIFPDSFPDEAFDAFVDKVSDRAEFTPKNVETKSQRAKLVFEVKLKIKENTNYRLKPGMPAEVIIKVDDNASWDSARK